MKHTPADTPRDASPDKGKVPNPEELAKAIEKTHTNDAPQEGNYPPHTRAKPAQTGSPETSQPHQHEPVKHEPAKHEPHK